MDRDTQSPCCLVLDQITGPGGGLSAALGLFSPAFTADPSVQHLPSPGSSAASVLGKAFIGSGVRPLPGKDGRGPASTGGSPFSHNQQTAPRERPPYDHRRRSGCLCPRPMAGRELGAVRSDGLCLGGKKTRHGQAPLTVQPHQLELLPRAPRAGGPPLAPPETLYLQIPINMDLSSKGATRRGSCEPGFRPPQLPDSTTLALGLPAAASQGPRGW